MNKDVHIEVNMIKTNATDDETVAAEKYINEKVIPALADADVLVVVIHKPTNEHSESVVKTPLVRKYSVTTIAAHMARTNPDFDLALFYTRPEIKDYVIIEHHITNGSVKVSTL